MNIGSRNESNTKHLKYNPQLFKRGLLRGTNLIKDTCSGVLFVQFKIYFEIMMWLKSRQVVCF